MQPDRSRERRGVGGRPGRAAGEREGEVPPRYVAAGRHVVQHRPHDRVQRDDDERDEVADGEVEEDDDHRHRHDDDDRRDDHAEAAQPAAVAAIAEVGKVEAAQVEYGTASRARSSRRPTRPPPAEQASGPAEAAPNPRDRPARSGRARSGRRSDEEPGADDDSASTQAERCRASGSTIATTTKRTSSAIASRSPGDAGGGAPCHRRPPSRPAGLRSAVPALRPAIGRARLAGSVTPGCRRRAVSAARPPPSRCWRCQWSGAREKRPGRHGARRRATPGYG